MDTLDKFGVTRAVCRLGGKVIRQRLEANAWGRQTDEDISPNENLEEIAGNRPLFFPRVKEKKRKEVEKKKNRARDELERVRVLCCVRLMNRLKSVGVYFAKERGCGEMGRKGNGAEKENNNRKLLL